MEVIICNKVGNYQEVENEVKLKEEKITQIAKQVELMMIIGSKEDIETTKLYDIAKQECSNVMLVEKIEDLYMNYIKRFKSIGIIVAQIASQKLVDKIVKIIKKQETEGYMYENSR